MLEVFSTTIFFAAVTKGLELSEFQLCTALVAKLLVVCVRTSE